MVQRTAIVGGGISGVAAAAALRAGHYEGDVVLIDPAELPYDRPPLSKDYLAGRRELQQIALRPQEWYSEQRVELLGRAQVTAIGPGKDTVSVQLGDGPVLRADHVVLATGGRAIRPQIPGGDAPGVLVLRDVADADALRARLAAVAGRAPRLLVVGGGLIGAETASTVRAMGAEVVLVDPMDPPLTMAAGSLVARYLHDQHAARGIETVRTVLESVKDLGADTGLAGRLQGEVQPRLVDVILVGVGMAPCTELAQAAGLDVQTGVLVDAGQVTSHPRVLAIGDCAQPRTGHGAGHWEAAQHDGQRAAATILGHPAPATTATWWWSDRHDHHVEGIGTMYATDAEHIVVPRGTIGAGPFAAFSLVGDRVIGAVSIDDPNAVRAARRIIDRDIRVEPAQLADPDTDLRRLLRS